MDAMRVPGDVENALARVGFRATGVLGPDRWLAVALDGSGRRLELQAMPALVDDALVARVARLRGVRHDHLVRLVDATELGADRLGLFVEHVEGLSLAQIRAARAPLTDGEAATVVIPIAGALGALHDADLVHGAVGPSTVVVRDDGRPALLDLRGVVLGSSLPSDDVAALVQAVLAQMPNEEVHLLTGGGGLRDALTSLPDPTPARVVNQCFRATDPEPVHLPEAGALASSALLTTARQAPAPATRRAARAGRRQARGRIAVLACAAVLAAGFVGARVVASDGPATAAQPADPVAAAVALSRLRAVAVGNRDADRLGEVEVVDGPAHAADLTLLARLDASSVDGITVDVDDARLVPDPGTRGATTDVAVTSTVSTAGVRGEARTVVLGLRWTDDGWRVWDVTSPAG